MPSRSAALAWSVALAVLFAGCTGGGSPKPSPADTDAGGVSFADDAADFGGAFAEGRGRIAGFVVDDSANPLDGVLVVNEATEQERTTDLTGAFLFDGAEVGVHRLRFERDGFEGRLDRVNVVSGLVSWHNATLRALPRGTPHFVPYEFEGFLECNHSLVPAATGGYAPNNCVPDRLVGLDASANSNARQTFVFPLAAGVREVLVEMVWERPETVPVGGNLRLVIEQNGTADGAGRTFMSYEGPSPARLELRPPVLPDAPYLLQTRTEVPEQEPGLAFQQPFTVFVTVFYVDPMPEDFTRLGTGS